MSKKKPTKKVKREKVIKKEHKSKTHSKKKSIKEKRFLERKILISIIIIFLLIITTVALLSQVLKSPSKVPDGTIVENENGTPELVLVEDPNCTNCQTDLYILQIKKQLFPNMKLVKVDYKSEKGKELIEKYELKTLPAYIFSEDITQTHMWENVKTSFYEYKNEDETKYIIDSQYIPVKSVVKPIDIDRSLVVIGDANAKVTLIEFGNYECYFCALSNGNSNYVQEFKLRAPDYTPAIPKIFEEYVNTGIAKYVYFNLGTESSIELHNAALCANEQGSWLNYNNLLYSNQEELMSSNSRTDDLISYAENLDLNTLEFKTCINENRYFEQIYDEIEFANSHGIDTTPTFIINDFIITGIETYETMKLYIEAELKE